MKTNTPRMVSTLLLVALLGSSLTGLPQTTNAPRTGSPTAQKTFCVDARHLGFPQQLLLASLQALANSNAPVLFVIHRQEDLSWRAAMERQLGRPFENISVDQALSDFGKDAPQVIYAPRQRWSLSIATTLAGINQGLLTDHPLDGHTIALDCRNRWGSKVDAYHWAIAELLPKCRPDAFLYLDEVLATMRDFGIQQKLFTLNLDPLNDPQDIKLLEEIFSKFPAQTTVFGWATGAYARKEKNQNDVMVEFALVSRLSRHGFNLVAADFSGNFSFYHRTGPYAGQLKQTRLDRQIKLEPGKRYVLLVNSDGDNLQYDLGRMRTHWEEADRPQIPTAWTIAPQLGDIGPAVLQAYYQEAAARGGWDEFVSGASGAGYVNPGSMTAAHLRQFIQSTRRLCDAADLRALTILDKGDRPSVQVAAFINAYASAKFDGLWFIAMPSYIGVAGGATAFLNERFRLGPRNAAEIARQIRQVRPSNPFIMIYVDGWETTAQTLRELVAGLGDSCVLVSSTEMAGLIRQWIATCARLPQLQARPDAYAGLTPVSSGDGEFRVTERDGTRCWLVPKHASPNYLYLDADDGFRTPAVVIELEYFNAGSGEISLDYDSIDPRASVQGAYKRHPNSIRRSNTAQWQQARFPITDARFGNRENGGTDFRFYNGGDDLLIRAVRVRRGGL